VSVSVVNGSGAYNQASDTAQSLAALGFHIAGVGDAAPVGDVSETVVYYGSRSPAVEAAAQRVAHSMTGSVIMGYDPSQVTDGAEVTVLTGTQFAVNAPPAPATPSTATVPSGASSTTPSTAAATPTTATTSPNASAIATPSPTTSGLEPWDPRACSVGAQPTAPVANPT
jgi:hypothetical protein